MSVVFWLKDDKFVCKEEWYRDIVLTELMDAGAVQGSTVGGAEDAKLVAL